MRAWSSDDVEGVLIEAARTLRRLPGAQLTRQQRMKSWWPDVPPDSRLAYGYNAARAPRIPVTPNDMTRLDMAMRLCWDFLTPDKVAVITCKAGPVPEDIHRIVWMRAAHWSWREIFEYRAAVYGHGPRGGARQPVPGGNTRQSLLPKYQAALAYLAAAWTQEGLDPDHLELHRTRWAS